MRNKIIFAIIVAMLLISGMLWIRTLLQIDKCLDGGGHWNDAEKKCIFSQLLTPRQTPCILGYLLT